MEKDPSLHTEQQIEVQAILEQHGLSEKGLFIERSDEEMDGNWTATGVKTDFKHPETGDIITAVKVSKYDEETGMMMDRAVPLDDLRAWNASPDEDTVSREQLPLKGAESAKREDYSMPERDKVLGVVESAGEVALLGLASSGDGKGTADQLSGNETASQLSSSEQAAYIAEGSRVDQAMTELYESWGLPEGADAEEAVWKIDHEVERVEGILQLLHGFDDGRRVGVNQLFASLDEGRMALSDKSRSAIEEFVGDRRFGELQSLANGREQAFLPAGIRAKLGDLSRGLDGLRAGFDDLNSRGPNFLNPEGAQLTMNSLRQIPEVTNLMTQARMQLQDMRNNLAGYQDTTPEAEGKEFAFRNEQVAQWEERLHGDLSPEELEAITQEIEAAVSLEAEMIDDPDSSSRWFGDRIQSNSLKSRNRIDVTGRPARAVPSRRYVAEGIVDMLRGDFRVDLISKQDPIVLDSNLIGGVEVGQHRAAALAMLYGNKWQEAADRLGFEVQQRQ